MKLQTVLWDHGCNPNRFLEWAKAPSAVSWREKDFPIDKVRLDNYVVAAFPWGDHRAYPWNAIDRDWLAVERKEAWVELEIALGWEDPLVIELRRVRS